MSLMMAGVISYGYKPRKGPSFVINRVSTRGPGCGVGRWSVQYNIQAALRHVTPTTDTDTAPKNQPKKKKKTSFRTSSQKSETKINLGQRQSQKPTQNFRRQLKLPSCKPTLHSLV
jgi:hypothetical protein